MSELDRRNNSHRGISGVTIDLHRSIIAAAEKVIDDLLKQKGYPENSGHAEHLKKRINEYFAAPRTEVRALWIAVAEYVRDIPNAMHDPSQPIATIQNPDPHDERVGIWFSLEDRKRLEALPAGTKLYLRP